MGICIMCTKIESKDEERLEKRSLLSDRLGITGLQLGF